MACWYRRQSGNSATSGSPSRARSQGLTTPGDSTMGGAEGEGKSSSWVWQFIKDERERAKMRACEKKGIPYTGPGGANFTIVFIKSYDPAYVCVRK